MIFGAGAGLGSGGGLGPGRGVVWVLPPAAEQVMCFLGENTRPVRLSARPAGTGRCAGRVPVWGGVGVGDTPG